MKWKEMNDLQHVLDAKKLSKEKKVLIYKHSTRCSTSRMVLDRLERNWNEAEMAGVQPFFLDLITYRNVSNAIAEQFNVEHESPQILILDKGEVVYDSSHFSIDYQDIKKVVMAAA